MVSYCYFSDNNVRRVLILMLLFLISYGLVASVVFYNLIDDSNSEDFVYSTYMEYSMMLLVAVLWLPMAIVMGLLYAYNYVKNT